MKDAREHELNEILLRLLLNLNIQQNQRMHPKPCILRDAIVKAIRLPRLREKDARNGLAEVVQLQSARADGVHDGCVVDDAGGDFFLPGSEDHVCMRRGSGTSSESTAHRS